MGFIKKIGLYFIGNMASKLMTALLVPIYTFYITAYDLGSYDYSQTIMQIAVPILYVAIWEAILKYAISSENKEQKDKYLSTAIVISMVSTVFMVLFVIIFHLAEPLPYPVLVCIMMLVYTYGMILQYCSRSLGENKIYVISGISATIVNFCGIICFVVIFRQGLFGLYISYILGQLASCLISFTKLKFWSRFRLSSTDRHTARVLLTFSVPLAINLASGWLINGAGRIVVKQNLGNEANGIYSYASKFGNLVTMITSVVSMALMEEFYIRMNDKGINGYFREKCNQIWNAVLSIFILVIPVIGFYFMFIQDTEYYVALQYIPVYVMATCMSSFATNVGGVFQLKNITQYSFLTTIAGGAVTLIISVLAVGKYGIMGVVTAQLFGAATMLATRYGVAKKLMEYHMDYGRTILFILLIIADSILLIKLRTIILEVLFFIINTLIVVVLNRKELGLVLDRIRKKAAKQ